MKEERLRSRMAMKENTKRQNFILGENRKKRLYQQMEEKFAQEVEMPELERRKHELGRLINYYLAKRRNFMNQQKPNEHSVKSGISHKIDSSVEHEGIYSQPYEQNQSKNCAFMF